MMSQTMNDWRTKGHAVLRAAVVVACYLIVFAGLLYTVAGAGTQ